VSDKNVFLRVGSSPKEIKDVYLRPDNRVVKATAGYIGTPTGVKQFWPKEQVEDIFVPVLKGQLNETVTSFTITETGWYFIDFYWNDAPSRNLTPKAWFHQTPIRLTAGDVMSWVNIVGWSDSTGYSAEVQLNRNGTSLSQSLFNWPWYDSDWFFSFAASRWLPPGMAANTQRNLRIDFLLNDNDVGGTTVLFDIDPTGPIVLPLRFNPLRQVYPVWAGANNSIKFSTGELSTIGYFNCLYRLKDSPDWTYAPQTEWPGPFPSPIPAQLESIISEKWWPSDVQTFTEFIFEHTSISTTQIQYRIATVMKTGPNTMWYPFTLIRTGSLPDMVNALERIHQPILLIASPW